MPSFRLAPDDRADGHRRRAEALRNGAPWELFDLKADRAETRNLAAQFPERVRELEQAWNQHLEEFRVLALKDPPADGESGAKPKTK